MRASIAAAAKARLSEDEGLGKSAGRSVELLSAPSVAACTIEAGPERVHRARHDLLAWSVLARVAVPRGTPRRTSHAVSMAAGLLEPAAISTRGWTSL
jgi:hypothetical protein